MKARIAVAVAAVALFGVGAFAQNSGTVPKGYVPIGKGPGVSGWASIAPGSNGNCLQVLGGVWSSAVCPGSGTGAIPYTSVQGVPSNTILGNNTGAPANTIALTGAQAIGILPPCSTGAVGTVPATGGGTTSFLRSDCTFAPPALFGSGAAGTVPASGGGTSNFLRADGTWTVPPTGVTYLNVACDNVTDIGATVNALLASGGSGTYQLPKGNCRTSISILPKTGQWLKGAGRHETSIIPIGTINFPTIFVDQQDYVKVSDMLVNQSATASSTNCFLIQFSQFFVLEDTSCYYAATPLGIQYKTVTGNGSNFYQVRGNIFYGASSHAAFFTYSNYGLISDNIVYGYTLAGINISEGSFIKISGNQIYASFSASGYGGIRLTPCERCVVTGNSVVQPSIGIVINGGQGNTVTGNAVESPYFQGYAVTRNNSPVANANFNSITGNTVLNPYAAAGSGCAFEVADFGSADGAQGNVFTGNTAIDQTGRMTKMFCNTITGGGPTYANKYDTNSNQASGVLGP